MNNLMLQINQLTQEQRTVLANVASTGQTAEQIAAKAKLSVSKTMQILATLATLRYCICHRPSSCRGLNLYSKATYNV